MLDSMPFWILLFFNSSMVAVQTNPRGHHEPTIRGLGGWGCLLFSLSYFGMVNTCSLALLLSF